MCYSAEINTRLQITVLQLQNKIKAKSYYQKKKKQEERGTLNKGGGRVLSANLAFTRVLPSWGREPQIFSPLNCTLNGTPSKRCSKKHRP